MRSHKTFGKNFFTISLAAFLIISFWVYAGWPQFFGFPPSVEVAEAANTPGDYLIRRNNASTTEITSTGHVVGWDTSVASNGSSISYSDSVFTLASGKYLVMWSERLDGDNTDPTNEVRTEVEGRLLINGTATTTAAGQAYNRNGETSCPTDCVFESVLSGAGILHIDNDSTTLTTHLQRTDTTGASQNVDRVVGWGGITILALDDSWDYARYSLSVDTLTVDNRADVVWDRTDEQDAGFSMSSGRITITNAGRYLIAYSIPTRVSGGARTEYNTVITRNNTTEIIGTQIDTYMRNTQGTDDGVISYIGVVDLSASDVIDVEMDMTDGTLSNGLMLEGSTIQILKLPAGNETFIMEATQNGDVNPASVTEFTWETTPHIDTNGFTDTSPTDTIIEPAQDGDYLFFATQFTGGGDRLLFTGRFSIENAIVTHAAGGSYTRNTTTLGGYSFGALLTGLTANDDISLENQGIAELTTALTASSSAMSGIRLASIFDNAAPNTPTLADTPSFDNLNASSTGLAIGGFAAFDDDGDAITFQLEIDDDINFGSPATTTASSDSTAAGWSATTFTSAATTTYIVQPGDGLANGTTYFWRVAAIDLSGTNVWTASTTARSFTIDTTITLDQWAQTTGLQFEDGTLTKVSTTTGGVKLDGW